MGFHSPLSSESDTSRCPNITIHAVWDEQELGGINFWKGNAQYGDLVCDGIRVMILRVLSDRHDQRIQLGQLRRVVKDGKHAGYRCMNYSRGGYDSRRH